MKPTFVRALAGAAVAAAFTAGAQAAELTAFTQPHFTGQKLTMSGDARDLARLDFEDQISSIVVHSGRWQLCSQPDFQGDCVVLERGRYPKLAENMNHRIESVREVGREGPAWRWRHEGYAPDERGR